MAKFKVLRVADETTVSGRQIIRDRSGKTSSVEFVETYVIADIKTADGKDAGFPSAYGHSNLKAGKVIEIKNARLAEKARANPDFEEVADEPKKAAPAK